MSSKIDSMERRKSKRYPLKGEVKIGTQLPEYFAYIMNISSHGMLLHSTKPYPKGTKLTIRIIDDSVLDLKTDQKLYTDYFGEVVWSRKEKSISLIGTKINNSCQQLINEYFK